MKVYTPKRTVKEMKVYANITFTSGEDGLCLTHAFYNQREKYLVFWTPSEPIRSMIENFLKTNNLEVRHIDDKVREGQHEPSKS